MALLAGDIAPDQGLRKAARLDASGGDICTTVKGCAHLLFSWE
ncbi:MAG: hypothetical protein ACJA06_001355 [Halocynthiibacter sp.]|jgi:hypothetical protein